MYWISTIWRKMYWISFFLKKCRLTKKKDKTLYKKADDTLAKSRENVEKSHDHTRARTRAFDDLTRSFSSEHKLCKL